MSGDRLELMAHLMRRVGVGARRDELEVLAARPYEEVVEELLHPEAFTDPDQDVIDRYLPAGATSAELMTTPASRWIYNLANGPRPLREKMALFWHHVFATAYFKSNHARAMEAQVARFRENGLGSMRQILLDLSRDPAMIDWLDNSENHANSVNENYGRELLELFSLGIGNYTEDDVKSVARAFTGWTIVPALTRNPWNLSDTLFHFDPADHDPGKKTFLGETVVDGEDVIEVLVKQEACARFIARHLYSFFVADELPVPSWSQSPPLDPAAIDALATAFLDSDGDIREVMRTLLNSDFFKAARFQRVKSPVEFVGGVIKLAGAPQFPDLSLTELGRGGGVDGPEAVRPTIGRGLAHGPGMVRLRHAHPAGQLRGRTGDGHFQAGHRRDHRACRRRRRRESRAARGPLPRPLRTARGQAADARRADRACPGGRDARLHQRRRRRGRGPNPTHGAANRGCARIPVCLSPKGGTDDDNLAVVQG